MSFLYPAFLIGALAVAVPVAVHLLRRDDAPEMPFTAVRLLRTAPLGRTRRRRLRDPLLLAARITALLLLVAAFARPFLTGSATEPPLSIVAIDRSYSMGAEGQFARALALARRIIDEAPRAGSIAVVAFDDDAEVVAEPGAAVAPRAVLDAIQPGFGRTRYGPVVTRALELSGSHAASLDIITAMPRSGWEGASPREIPAALRVRLHDVGLPPSNATVTAVRRVDDGVVASIGLAGEEALSAAARLIVDGHVVAEMPITVPAGDSIEVAFRHDLPEGGAVAVEIDDPAGFPADDVRYLAPDPTAFLGVLVVVEHADGSGFYLTRALEASGEPMRVRHVAPSHLGRLAAAEWAEHDVVVALSTRGMDLRGRDALAGFVEGGGGLLVAAAADLDAAVLASVMSRSDIEVVETRHEHARLAVTDPRHPIVQPFGVLAANLGDVRIDRFWLLRETGWDVAARFSGGAPALLERQHGSGRIVLFASDLDRRWNDFPRHPAFVVFAVESIRHLSGRLPAPREYVVAEAPPGAGPEPGVYTLPTDGRRVAVNVDVREPTLARMTEDEFFAMLPSGAVAAHTAVSLPATQVEARQGLWRYAILLVLGLLLTESFMGRPR